MLLQLIVVEFGFEFGFGFGLGLGFGLLATVPPSHPVRQLAGGGVDLQVLRYGDELVGELSRGEVGARKIAKEVPP